MAASPAASEALRALDEAMTPQWAHGEPLIEGPFAQGKAAIALRNALPLIRDCIEAAESYVRFDEQHMRRIDTSDIRNALAALRDSLGVEE